MEENREFVFETSYFFSNHKKELDYLLLCPLCLAFNPKAVHKRKIFNSFLRCEKDLQEKISAKINIKPMPNVDENFLKIALKVYRKYQAALQLGDAYPNPGNNYTPLFYRAFRLYRYTKIPMSIRKYTIGLDFSTKPNQTIMNYIEDYVSRLRFVNATNDGWYCPPFDLVNSEGEFFRKRESVYLSWGLYLLLLGTNVILKVQGSYQKTAIDHFLENDLIESVEDLYYLTLYALVEMLNNEEREKNELL